ncbi:MAG: hypothetical protein ABIR87_00290 [Sphingomicrobium sp.]
MLARYSHPRLASAAVSLVLVLLLFAVVVQLGAVVAKPRPDDWLLVEIVPTAFYLWAIWTARRAIVLIGRGGLLHSILSQMLMRVGAALLLGGLSRVFFMPWLTRVLSGAGPYAYYDVSAITVGVVGVTLIIVSRVVADAGAMRAELDEFL